MSTPPVTVFMDLPTYLETDNESSYHEYLSQALRDGLSNKGWTVPQVTKDQLTTLPVQNPTDGSQVPTLWQSMPDGTLWFILDQIPPCYVGKINGALVKFSTTPYP